MTPTPQQPSQPHSTLTRIFASEQNLARPDDLRFLITNVIGHGHTLDTALTNLDRMRQEIKALVDSAPKNLESILDIIRHEVEGYKPVTTSEGATFKCLLKNSILLLLKEAQSETGLPTTIWAAEKAHLKPSAGDGSLVDAARRLGIEVTLGDWLLVETPPEPAGFSLEPDPIPTEPVPLKSGAMPTGFRPGHDDPLMRRSDK